MGWAARHNLRSPEGGKPKGLNALHRIWRAVQVFGEDRDGLIRWLDSTQVSDEQRATVLNIWDIQHPKPLVTIETVMPS